jgi:succinate dehydrogenase/fumarate reductase-like Fe-S protein
VDEPRDRDLDPVLALAAEPDSVWRCRDAIECTAVCPSAVEPAMALSRLRRHVAAQGLKRRFGRGA